MSETQAASQGEETQTGIFAGPEKYMSAEAQEATEKAKEDLTREGMPVLASENKTTEKVKSDSVTPISSDPSKSRPENAPKEAKPVTLSPQLLDMLQACDVSDTDFVAWLHQHGQDESFVPTKDQVLSARGSGEQKISTVGLVLEGHKKHEHKCRRHGPVGSVLHALHLDRRSRRKEQHEQRQDEAELKEKLDMEQWEEKMRRRHASKEAKKRARTEDAGNEESDSCSDDSSSSDESKPATSAVPLSMLNPEFVEKKEKEEEILSSGGDLSELSVDSNKENDIHISSERIDQLINSDRSRIKAGLPPAEDETAVATSG